MDIGSAFLKGLTSDETDGKEHGLGGERRTAYFELPSEEDYALLLELDPSYKLGEIRET